MAQVAQYKVMLASISSRGTALAGPPSLSIPLRNFSTIQAASPAGESFMAKASVCGFVP